MSQGLIVAGVAGVVLFAVTLADVFVTIFNYDGFTFIAARFHRLLWRALRVSTSRLPARARAAVLSLGSAAMLPATLILWLALEISAFALIYWPGLAGGRFRLSGHLPPQIGMAYYFSAGDITSLTFGDVVARSGLYRAVVDVETAVGLATVSLAVTYVLTAFDALGSLDRLHGRSAGRRPSRTARPDLRRPGRPDRADPLGASRRPAAYPPPLPAGPGRRIHHHRAPAAEELRRPRRRHPAGAAARRRFLD